MSGVRAFRVPNQPKTPNRVVRVPDDLWHAAQAKAAERGEKVSEVIRKSLARYVDGGDVMDREPGCTCTLDGTYWPGVRRDSPDCPAHHSDTAAAIRAFDGSMRDLFEAEGAALARARDIAEGQS